MSSNGPADPPDPKTAPDGVLEPISSGDAVAPPDPLTPADPVWPPAPPARPGASTFTIEGRAAPGLFVVGWLASLLGLGAIFIGVLSGGMLTSTIIVGVGLVLLTVGLVSAAGSQGLDRRAAASDPYWAGIVPYRGPSPVLVFAAAIPISIIAIIAAAIPMGLLGIPVDGPFGRLVSVLLQTLVYVGLIRLLVVDVGALSWAEMGVRRLDGSAVGEIASGAIWAIPVIAATVPIAVLLQSAFSVTPVSPLPPSGEAAGFAMNLIAGAIIAPFGEELMFRGLTTTAWLRGLGPRLAIVLGAVFFALVHVLTVSASDAGEAAQLMVLGFTTRLPVGLALGYLFVKRRSIWVPFGLHAAFNGILLILAEMALRAGVPGV